MTAADITPNDAQQVRDACDLGRYCASCGHPADGRNPLVLTEDGYRVHVSHVLDPDSGHYGKAFAECRPLAEIADNALMSDCGCCWAGPGKPCKAGGGAMHLARFGRAERHGLIAASDMAVVTAGAGPGALPGTVIPAGVLTGAAT